VDSSSSYTFLRAPCCTESKGRDELHHVPRLHLVEAPPQQSPEYSGRQRRFSLSRLTVTKVRVGLKRLRAGLETGK